MKNEKIIGLEIVSDVFKSTDNTGRACFALAGVFTLHDGRKVGTTITSQRKRDLPRVVESERGYINNGALSATFDEHGQYFGTRTEVYIGPAK